MVASKVCREVSLPTTTHHWFSNSLTRDTVRYLQRVLTQLLKEAALVHGTPPKYPELAQASLQKSLTKRCLASPTPDFRYTTCFACPKPDFRYTTLFASPKPEFRYTTFFRLLQLYSSLFSFIYLYLHLFSFIYLYFALFIFI